MELTIEYKGVELDVVFHHQPEERSDINYPGCQEHIEICEINHMGVCFLEVFEDFEDEIIEIIYKELNE